MRGEPTMAELPCGELWYEKGLRFACTQCGNCCTGPPGYVWFTEEEGERIAAQLGIAIEAFYHTYARKEGSRWSLRERKVGDRYDCIFLDRETTPGKAVCTIYEARPTQCRTWPFWPENLRSRRTWRQVKRNTPCPGMDTGKLVPVEKVRILRDQTP